MPKSHTIKFKNETEINHSGANGTFFEADRGDLQNGVVLSWQFDSPSPLKLAADFAEFGAWHAMHIRPHLNGFRGYDCITYKFKD